MQLYEAPSGIDIGRLVRGRVRWVNSRDSWVVQLADIAAFIVYRATMDLDDSRGSVSTFGSLMKSSPYGPIRGPGLFSPLDPDAPDADSEKYSLLFEVMERNARRSRAD